MELALLYDSHCPVCVGGIRALRRLDAAGIVKPLDLHDDTVRARFPSLRAEDLMSEIHAIDESGKITRGADAFREVLKRQRGWRRGLAAAWFIPGFGRLSRALYRIIAARRYAISALPRRFGGLANSDRMSLAEGSAKAAHLLK